MNLKLDSVRFAAASTLCALVLLPVAAHSAPNSWINNNAGKWETNSNWSAGAPTNTQTCFITNAFSKTVTIDSTTTNFPTTLTISNLTVSAPVVGFNNNRLFLNNSGLATPLRILNFLKIDSGGTLLVSSNSVVQVDNPTFSGFVSIDGGGIVNLDGGTLAATNQTTSLGVFTTGEIVVNNGTLRTRNLFIANNAGAQGTLSLQAGLAEMRADWSIASAAGSTGAVWMTGGQLVASNGFTTIGSGGSGQMAVSNGTMFGESIFVGKSAGARGTLTIAGGTIETGLGAFPMRALTAGDDANATGVVWITSGQLIATNSLPTLESALVIGRSGIGRLTLSNGTVNVGTVTVAQNAGSAGTLTVAGGTFTAERLLATNSAGRIEFTAGTMTLRGADVANATAFSVGGVGQTAVLNLPAGTNEFVSGMKVGPVATSTGLVWLTGGQLTTTNTLTLVGDAGVGQMTVSNGTWLAGLVTLGDSAGGRGTLTLAGGTNTLSSALTTGTGFASTGAVWLTGGQLVVTNNNTTVGDEGVGQMTVSNGTWRARDVIVGNIGGSQGTLTVAGGTNIVSLTLRIGNDNGNGSLWLNGGQLTVTNDITYVGYIGSGQMTVFSNSIYRVLAMSVGFNAGSRGTFTLAGGSPEFAGGVTIGENAGATGNVWLLTGSLLITNPALESVVGLNGNGQMTVSNGLLRAHDFRVGRNAGSQGTLTIAGGTNVFNSFLSIASLANATGTVWVTGGLVVVTNIIISVAGAGTGQLIISNGVVLAKSITLAPPAGGRGTFTMAGGSVTVDSLIVSNANTRVRFDAGSLSVTNSTRVVNGLGLTVGENGGGTAILNLSGGTHELTNFLNVGTSATGQVWLSSGQLIVTNDVTRVGNQGDGSLVVSNGTVLLKELQMGVATTGHGTFTSVGGTINVSGPVALGVNAGATGTLWLTGGQLTATNNNHFIGFAGAGRVTVSNGTWAARNVIVALGGGSLGTLTVAGGVSSVYSNLTVANFACTATGIVNVTAGELRVTNNTATAVLEVRGGTLTQSGGTLEIDRLIITNSSCGSFIHTGGTLITGLVMLDPNSDADGDGIPNSWEQAAVLDPFNPNDAALDDDGDGLTNLQEFNTDTDPHNPADFLHIRSIIVTNSDVLITWPVGQFFGIGLAYRVQTGNDVTSVTNNLGADFIFSGTATVTNYLDIGGATNVPPRFYRVRGLID